MLKFRGYDLKIFLPFFVRQKIGVFAKTSATIGKILIITLVFEENANFFAENWRK
jgi:hypothetical protein